MTYDLNPVEEVAGIGQVSLNTLQHRKVGHYAAA